jgi:ribosomal-protein-alanine N-acetyltransferase
MPLELVTPRMRLVASTPELVRAEIGDPQAFGRLLDAGIPNGWPPDESADALPWFLEQLERAGPTGIGWYGFYGIVLAGEPGAPVLVGGGGSLGPPAEGSVEIGYSLLPEFQRRGYATEMMSAIVDWIVGDPRVTRVTAETATQNLPSRRLLERLSFHEAGAGREPDTVAYARTARPQARPGP